jgi:putative PIN family toxin of toxin-antitoxin system
LLEARAGALEIVASPLLLEELTQVLGREKFRRYVDLDTTRDYIGLLRRDAVIAADPDEPGPLQSADPDDDYLIALARSQNAVLVSGDKHLLDLTGGAPILSASDLLASLA